MRRDVRIKSDFSLIPCPECNECLHLVISSFCSTKCENCYSFKNLFRCSAAKCKFQKMICRTCDVEQFTQQSNLVKWSEKSQTCNSNGVSKDASFSSSVLLFSAALLLLFILTICHLTSYFETSEDMNVNVLKLRERYMSQRNETWYHFMGVLEKKVPTVKTITFLHGKDRKTTDCLTKELLSLYTQNRKIKNEEITFSDFAYEVKDYGIVLEHYRPIIKKFRILITDLNKVTGNIARIFHSLCDEFSSDTKPSLFIFTLQYGKGTENLKPVERATNLLKEAWNDLPESELFPLLSRVIKNVVDIIPEDSVLC